MQDHWWWQIGLGAWMAAWSADIASGGSRRERLLLYPRIVHSVGRELHHGQLGLRAASLVYTTLLSLVPLLAVSFALLKGFGVHEEVQHLLYDFLTPLGPNGVEVGQRIVGFVDNVKVGVLGSVGLLVLIYTVISLMQKIESAFNYAWRIDRVRPLRERISHYLAALVVGPVLVFTSIGITATVLGSATLRDIAAYDPFGFALTFATKAASYVLVIAAFALLYLYIPHARVRLRSALVGAVVAGVLWEAAGWGFAAFVVGSTNYTAIYSGFAVLVVFMLWLYAGWLVLLIGASVAFYHQHRECLGLLAQEVRLSNRMRERAALSVVLLVARHHLHGKPPLTGEMLSKRLSVPMGPLAGVLRTLAKRGVLLEPGDAEGPWLPARDLSELRVADVLSAARSAYEDMFPGSYRGSVEDTVRGLADRIDVAVAEVAGPLTLRDWVLASGADSQQADPPVAPDSSATPDPPMPSNAVSLSDRKRDSGQGR